MRNPEVMIRDALWTILSSIVNAIDTSSIRGNLLAAFCVIWLSQILFGKLFHHSSAESIHAFDSSGLTHAKLVIM
jgi:hypothetical protein